MGELRKSWDALQVTALGNLVSDLDRMLAEKEPISDEAFIDVLQIVTTSVYRVDTDLSRKIEVSKSALSKWLSGKASPTAPTKKSVITTISQDIRSKIQELSL